MTNWSVSVTAGAPAGRPIKPEDAYELAETLRAEASVTFLESRIGATFGVTAATARAAGAEGLKMFGAALRAAGVGWPLPILRLEIMTHEELARELADPPIPALVGVQEAAEILEVTKQRVNELALRSKSFPRPVTRLASGRVWSRSAIEAFKQNRPGKPGRPRATTQVS